MPERILMIETSTAQLSVALSVDGVIVYSRKSTEKNTHASLCAVFIKEALDSAGIKADELTCVAVCGGPGSYTGLRVGTSSAKGICFGAKVKLVAIPTTDILAAAAIGRTNADFIIPMIDARRMEVYSAVYSPEGKKISDTQAVIVDANSYSAYKGVKCFIGDGALKCKEVLGEDGNLFIEAFPEAEDMLPLAQEAIEEGRFEDVAYFEPFYLKDFVVTESKKKLF
ncbi:MAG: tRNA (adenosine(37)-N6)-threonylcarbamoyltransferase complex dimerization subunit type 1 TsaB [Bacteroidales bacterium]|nr:tRNA (adenosine(37)-N6)-threonylcarbamoyltransferase complex dimerization subunit type 1 TsaB [Bacteroidales bacterium]